MSQRSIRGLLLLTAMLTMLAVAATPAHAVLTAGATRTSSGRATDTRFVDNHGDILAGDSDVTCTIAADGRSASCNVSFTRVRGTRGGISVDMRCVVRGRITIRSTSSVAGTSASGDLVLDAGFDVTCRDTFNLFVISVVGPQGPFVGALTFNQATQSLNVNARGLRGTENGAAITATYTATYHISTVPPLTVS